jgi:thioredoxin 1
MAVIEGKIDNFEEVVLKSKEIVLVDFNADWCGPCQMLKPIIEELAEKRNDVKIVSVNVDDEDLLAEKYGVSSIPCLVVFKDGKEINRNVGFIQQEEIESLLGE